MKESLVEFDGVVTKKVKGAKFEVSLENGHTVLCTLSGRMRVHNISVSIGDRVTIEMSLYDLKNGRIAYRF